MAANNQDVWPPAIGAWPANSNRITIADSLSHADFGLPKVLFYNVGPLGRAQVLSRPVSEHGIDCPSALRQMGRYVCSASHEATVLCKTLGVSPDVEELVQRLEQLNEDLAELAMSRLRDSIDAGGDKLPVDEKLITRARRSVEKATTLLRSTGGSEPEFF